MRWKTSWQQLSDEALRARTDEFKKQLAEGATLDDILVPAFATVREAGKRALGQRHFDVQLIGGMVLHEGRISEMKTGEGKTLVATLPVYLNALAGRGVHVVTVNDYLAKRDAEWMGQIYKFLGLTVGVIVHGLDDEQRKKEYDCDVTYGTNNELGFDYLRDNMKYRLEDMVQRGHAYAIVDEVDSILIDEARTPLIISGPLDDRSEFYNTIDTYIPNLDKADYEVDEKQRTVTLTEVGMEKMEQALRDRRPAQIRLALRRRERLGRASRQSGAARAQAVPARQGLHRPQRRGRHHRRVHRPHDAGPALFGRAAPGARGQGAAADPAGEPDARLDHLPELFPHVQEARRHDRHGGDRGRRVPWTSTISKSWKFPTNMPMVRIDDDDEVYRTATEKYRAILTLIEDCKTRGQPVLVGTTSIEKSEQLAEMLRTARLGAARLLRSQRVRRALFRRRGRLARPRCSPSSTPAITSRKPQIVAQAGVPGAITIATNMAGRGTDIQLGGNADMRIRQELADIDDWQDARQDRRARPRSAPRSRG